MGTALATAPRARKSIRPADGRCVSDLYREFETAIDAMNAMPPSKEVHDRPFERAVDKCSRLAELIVRARASNIDEMLLKIRVVGWCASARRGAASAVESRYLDGYDNWKPDGFWVLGEQFDALVSLRADLRRLQAAGLGGAGVWLRPEERNVDGTARCGRRARSSSASHPAGAGESAPAPSPRRARAAQSNPRLSCKFICQNHSELSQTLRAGFHWLALARDSAARLWLERC
jgi:hypothetical protein